jgi:hypothetical protein
MKFTVSFKTPDVTYYQVDNEEQRKFTEQWIHSDETVDIEFNTETGTATVVKK